MFIFESEWLNQPLAIAEEDRRFYELAVEYHRTTEEFDKKVCSGKRHGVAMPTNGQEGGMVNRNAKQVIADITKREDPPDPESFHKDLLRAIRNTAHDFERSLQ